MAKLWTAEMSNLTGIGKVLADTRMSVKEQQSLLNYLQLTSAQKHWMETSFEGDPEKMTRLCKSVLRILSGKVYFKGFGRGDVKLVIDGLGETSASVFPKLFFGVLNKQKGHRFFYPNTEGKTCSDTYGHKSVTAIRHIFLMAVEWMAQQQNEFFQLEGTKKTKDAWALKARLYAQEITPREASQVRLNNFWERHGIPSSPDIVDNTAGVPIAEWMRNVAELSFGVNNRDALIQDKSGAECKSRVHIEPFKYSFEPNCDVSGLAWVIMNTPEAGFIFNAVPFEGLKQNDMWVIKVKGTWNSIVDDFLREKTLAKDQDPDGQSLYRDGKVYGILPHLNISGDVINDRMSNIFIKDGLIIAPLKGIDMDAKSKRVSKGICSFLKNSGSLRARISYSISTLIKETSSPEEARALKIFRGIGLSLRVSDDVRLLSQKPAIMDICDTHPMLGALLIKGNLYRDTSNFHHNSASIDHATCNISEIFKKLDIPKNLQRMIFSKSPKVKEKFIFHRINIMLNGMTTLSHCDFRLLNEYFERSCLELPKTKPLDIFAHILNMSQIIDFLETLKSESFISLDEYKQSRRYKVKQEYINLSQNEINDGLMCLFRIFKFRHSMKHFICFLVKTGIIRKNAFIADIYSIICLFHKNNDLINGCERRIGNYSSDITVEHYTLDEWLPLHDSWACDSGRLEFLTTAAALKKESQDLSHCVRSYDRTCFGYMSFIAKIVGNDGTRSTLELKGGVSKENGFLGKIQNKSYRNAPPSGDAKDVWKKYSRSKEYRNAIEKHEHWRNLHVQNKKIIAVVDGKQSREDWEIGLRNEFQALTALLLKNKPDIEKILTVLEQVSR